VDLQAHLKSDEEGKSLPKWIQINSAPFTGNVCFSVSIDVTAVYCGWRKSESSCDLKLLWYACFTPDTVFLKVLIQMPQFWATSDVPFATYAGMPAVTLGTYLQIFLWFALASPSLWRNKMVADSCLKQYVELCTWKHASIEVGGEKNHFCDPVK